MLVIGKKRTSNNPSKVGGAIILFEQLLIDLNREGMSYEVVDTNYRNYHNKVWAVFKIYYLLLKKGIKHRRIFFNGSSNFVLLFWLPITILEKIYKKKIILRFFGGDFDVYLEKENRFLQRLIYKRLKSAKLLFFEQKYQVFNFKHINVNTHWFPNVRYICHRENFLNTEKEFHGRFVFVGHVRREKGINEILTVKNKLKENFDIQLFGPIVDYHPPTGLEKVFEEIYKGSLEPDEVTYQLSNFDVLVLPSYKEGYSGIVIEALAVGLPVIVSCLPAIEEMLNGDEVVFIKPRDSSSLERAILHFNSDNYLGFSKAALKSSNQYDSQVQMPRILKLINES